MCQQDYGPILSVSSNSIKGSQYVFKVQTFSKSLELAICFFPLCTGDTCSRGNRHLAAVVPHSASYVAPLLCVRVIPLLLRLQNLHCLSHAMVKLAETVTVDKDFNENRVINIWRELLHRLNSFCQKRIKRKYVFLLPRKTSASDYHTDNRF